MKLGAWFVLTILLFPNFSYSQDIYSKITDKVLDQYDNGASRSGGEREFAKDA
jgi:hypothetical protein